MNDIKIVFYISDDGISFISTEYDVNNLTTANRFYKNLSDIFRSF